MGRTPRNLQEEWEDAPITRSFLTPFDEKGRPPYALEWTRLAQEDQDAIVFWAGEWNRNGTHLGWGWIWRHTGDKGAVRDPLVTKTPAANDERLLSPLAHEARIRLMQTMQDGVKTSGELAEATGLKGGNLYYHLKELIHAAYVSEKEGGYDLTGLGCQMLLTVTAIAANVVKDRGEEGLVVGGSFGQ